MRKVAVVLIALAVLSVTAAHVQAFQSFANTQVARGYSNNDWSFMTAWDLADGDLVVSDPWFDGYALLEYYEHMQHWTAQFIYDEGTGTTRELKWSWIELW